MVLCYSSYSVFLPFFLHNAFKIQPLLCLYLMIYTFSYLVFGNSFNHSSTSIVPYYLYFLKHLYFTLQFSNLVFFLNGART